jgi:hypothetical protein
MNARGVVAALLLVGSSVARAEVRIVGGADGPELLVQPVARGIWTPRGVPSTSTINPNGDSLGDGYPGHASLDGRLLAAWVRPTTNTLVVLRASAPTSFEATEVGLEGAVGTPLVSTLGDAWLVTLQVQSPEPHVVGLVATESGVPELQNVVPGQLVGVYLVGDSIHVVARQAAEQSLLVATLSRGDIPNPIPIPVTRVPLTYFPNPIPVPIPIDRTTADLASPTWMPCVEERGDDVLVAWQAGRGVIGRITLDAYGVNGAGEFFRGPSGSCQAVLNAASRQ